MRRPLFLLLLLLVSLPLLAQEVAPATPGSESEILVVSLLAGAIVSLVVALIKILPISGPSWSHLQKGAVANKLLVPISIVVGVGFVILKAWFLGLPIRSASGWDLLLSGVMLGATASGFRAWAKALSRTKEGAASPAVEAQG